MKLPSLSSTTPSLRGNFLDFPLVFVTKTILRAVGFSYVPPVCFSIEHARARHAPRDAFDVNFICQLFFSLEVFVQKNANVSPKALTKERSRPSSKYSYLVCGLNVSLNLKLPCPLSCGIAELVEHNTPNNNSKQY